MAIPIEEYLTNNRMIIIMKESITETTKHFTPCTSLEELDLFCPIRKSMKIAQKIVKYAVQKEGVYGSDSVAQGASFVE